MGLATEIWHSAPSFGKVWLLNERGECWGQSASTCNLTQGLLHLQRDASPRSNLHWAAHIERRLGHFGWMWDALIGTLTPEFPIPSAPALLSLHHSSAPPSMQSCIPHPSHWYGSLINNWHPELCLRICFWRTQPATLVINDLKNNPKDRIVLWR